MFKDQMMNDIDIMLNINEFAETVSINGTEIPIIIDNDRLSKRNQDNYEGVVGDCLYFAKSSSFQKKPNVGDMQTFKGSFTRVIDVNEDNGLLEILLQRGD